MEGMVRGAAKGEARSQLKSIPCDPPGETTEPKATSRFLQYFAVDLFLPSVKGILVQPEYQDLHCSHKNGTVLPKQHRHARTEFFKLCTLKLCSSHLAAEQVQPFHLLALDGPVHHLAARWDLPGPGSDVQSLGCARQPAATPQCQPTALRVYRGVGQETTSRDTYPLRGLLFLISKN